MFDSIKIARKSFRTGDQTESRSDDSVFHDVRRDRTHFPFHHFSQRRRKLFNWKRKTFPETKITSVFRTSLIFSAKSNRRRNMSKKTRKETGPNFDVSNPSNWSKRNVFHRLKRIKSNCTVRSRLDLRLFQSMEYDRLGECVESCNVSVISTFFEPSNQGFYVTK